MREYNQGDAYMEYQEDEELEYDESAEDTSSEDNKIFGVPVKVAVLGGAVVVAVILGLVFLGLRKKPQPDVVTTDQIQQLEQAINNVSVESTTTTDTVDSAPAGDVLKYDEATGTWVSSGSTSTVQEEIAPINISDEDRIRLRQLGYTGDEIDFALSNGFDVEGLIKEVEKLYDEEADAALKRMSDSASEEFRYVIDNTYFSQEGYEFVDITELPFGEADYYHGSYVVNADYVKCPTYGAQLQLKCKVSSDLDIFHVVTPERFASLPESGNIVLEVFYTVFGSSIYVTDVVETDKSINPIDNTTISQEALRESIIPETPTEDEVAEEVVTE